MSMALLCRFCFFNSGSFDWSSHHLPHTEAAKTLVLAFVSICLDYCNSLLYGIGDGLLKKLQIVGLRNSAARVVAVKTVNGPITSVYGANPGSWLPIRLRIHFKLTLIIFTCLHGHETVGTANHGC